MTNSQEKVLKYHQSFDSYQNHYMKDKNLIIECETELNEKPIPYILVIGVRGGKRHLQRMANGEWRVT